MSNAGIIRATDAAKAAVQQPRERGILPKSREIRMLYYISSYGAWNATPRNAAEIMIILGDARQHGSVRQGVILQKAARTDARASFLATP
jgi:hypothetical protein